MLKKRIRSYKKQRDIRLSGGLTCIPFEEHLPAISRFVPGIIKGAYYTITSYTNVGKTPLAKHLFIKIPLYYYNKCKGTKNEFSLKIFYFCLEETEDQFIDSLVASMLYRKYNITIDYNALNSFSNTLEDGILQKINTLHDDFEKIESVLTVVDNVSTPGGIIKVIRNYARKNGTYYKNNVPVDSYEDCDYYVPHNPDEHVIIVTDHVNILTSTDSLFKAMYTHSTENMLNECVKLYNYSVCDVQQQAAEGESADYNKFNKNECSLTTLGDNKIIGRNYHVVFALDMPQRYGVTEHGGYKLREFGENVDRYRSLKVLKNRFGRSQVRRALWFTPQAISFEELPIPSLINYKNYVL